MIRRGWPPLFAKSVTACGGSTITSAGERSMVAVKVLPMPMNIPAIDSTSNPATASAMTAAR
jgi:hypothetical protein